MKKLKVSWQHNLFKFHSEYKSPYVNRCILIKKVNNSSLVIRNFHKRTFPYHVPVSSIMFPSVTHFIQTTTVADRIGQAVKNFEILKQKSLFLFPFWEEIKFLNLTQKKRIKAVFRPWLKDSLTNVYTQLSGFFSVVEKLGLVVSLSHHRR